MARRLGKCGICSRTETVYLRSIIGRCFGFELKQHSSGTRCAVDTQQEQNQAAKPRRRQHTDKPKLHQKRRGQWLHARCSDHAQTSCLLSSHTLFTITRRTDNLQYIYRMATRGCPSFVALCVVGVYNTPFKIVRKTKEMKIKNKQTQTMYLPNKQCARRVSEPRVRNILYIVMLQSASKSW